MSGRYTASTLRSISHSSWKWMLPVAVAGVTESAECICRCSLRVWHESNSFGFEEMRWHRGWRRTTRRCSGHSCRRWGAV